MKTKIAVIGSRKNYPTNPKEDIKKLLKLENLNKDQIIIVSGGAVGVDSIAEQWATEEGVEKLIFRADWKKFGKGAGYIRNHLIIENADIILAVWDGESRGTRHSLYLAKKSGKKIYLSCPEVHIAGEQELPDKITYKTTENE